MTILTRFDRAMGRVPHTWEHVRMTERRNYWRCSICKARLIRHRGLIESDESFEANPPADFKGGCDIELRIAHLEAELKMLREKLVESTDPGCVLKA